jgi:SAM-dependent methyltransferase
MEATAAQRWLAQWEAEEQVPFSGWDFSYLAGRMVEEALPWDYLAQAAARMDQARSALEMETGGGEKLLGLRPHWPPRLIATEEYLPNLALARQRLEPLGVHVAEVRCTEIDPLPFADGEFDLVLNRHGAFNPDEVARILALGGVFLTQQVHGMHAADLMARFGAKPQWPDATPERYAPWLERAGLTIRERKEWTGRLRFTDVGALVYYLKAVPWTVEGFAVARDGAVLLEMQEQLERGEALEFHGGHYLIEARKV